MTTGNSMAHFFSELEAMGLGRSEYIDRALDRRIQEHLLRSAELFGPLCGWDPVELAECVKAVRDRQLARDRVVPITRARRRARKGRRRTRR